MFSQRTLSQKIPPTPPNPQAGLSDNLDEILITDLLLSRPRPAARLGEENEALITLARIMSDSPRQLVPALLHKAMELCRADAAGLSLLETNAEGEEIFRWSDLAGSLKEYVGGSTPRHHSPCGVTLDRKSAQLFSHPARYFHYFKDVAVPIVEGLVLPLAGGGPAGTLWIVSQNDRTHFNGEDARLMSSLIAFASSALRMIALLDGEVSAREKWEANLLTRNEAEEHLRANEEFTRRIIDSSSDCIKVLDLDFHITYMSPYGLRLMEIDNFNQCENADWRYFWKEADQPMLMAAVNTALSGGVGTFHSFCPTMKGTPKWWDVVVTPIKDAEGRVVKLLSSSRDVTERKHAEVLQRQNIERYQTLADSMPQMVWTAQPDGFVNYYNRQWFDYTGLTLEQTQGWGWKQTQHPDDVEISVSKWHDSLKTGAVFENEMRFLRAADQSWRWHFTRAIPALDKGGQVIQWIGTCTDIDDRKATEQALRVAREQLEARVIERTAELRQEINDRGRAEDELRELSAKLLTLKDTEQRRIARDLHDSAGQLLTATTMSLAMVAKESSQLSPDAVKSLSQAEALVQETIKEIRVMSHLLHPPLLDETGLCSALRWYLEGFSERGDVKVDLVIADDFGRLTSGLETAIFRVVQECLTNIHRHSGSKTARVEVARFPAEIRVSVEDKGKGIPGGRSSGVGLRGMKERVGQFGGRLEIYSSAIGTTVIARLPVEGSDLQRSIA